MNTVIQTVPDLVAEHLREAASRFGLENSETTYLSLEKGWTEKMIVFEQEMSDLGMQDTAEFDPLDERAALFLTYSGSLLSLGPIVDGAREIRYTSIGFRKDVPESLVLDNANIAEPAFLGKPVSFKEGPIKQTSPLYKIVVPPASMEKEDQTCLIEDAVTVISEKFSDMNQDLLGEV